MYNEIEYINNLRIDIVNSEEYNNGRRIKLLCELLKGFHFIKIVKILIRYLKIKKLSYHNKKQYTSIKCNNVNYTNKRIVIYSCITGNYDKCLTPLFHADNIEYVLFTDNPNIKTDYWKIVDINNMKKLEKLSLAEKNRYIKMNPYSLFENKYDYAIYIDGNIQVVSEIRKLINCINDHYGISMHEHRNRNDIYNEYKVCKLLNKGNKEYLEKQIAHYKRKKFPKNYGMLEANVFAVDLKNQSAKVIMSDWYKEFENSKSGRDQISLPYILWHNHIEIKDIATMGSDVYRNPIFYINSHERGEKK